MAIIRLKRALGRSMRREHQRSLTLILDGRLSESDMAKQMVTSLAKRLLKPSLNPKLMGLLINF